MLQVLRSQCDTAVMFYPLLIIKALRSIYVLLATEFMAVD